MDAYVGLETHPGSQDSLYKILKRRQIEAHRTLGAHDIICRVPSFTNLEEFRKTIDSMLFTTERDKPLVENTTSYIIIDQSRKKTDKETTAFCFFRFGGLPSRTKFDKMVRDLLNISSIVAVSVVIGLFDLVCEVITKNVAELKTTVDKVLTTPGVSPRATMVCIVVGTDGSTF
jgi:hypothetical protein